MKLIVTSPGIIRWLKRSICEGVSECREGWAGGSGIKMILRPMKTDPALINTGRLLFLPAVCRQTFWTALSDAWSKIGHRRAQ